MGGSAGGPYCEHIEEPPWMCGEPHRLSRPIKHPPPLTWWYTADPMLRLLAILPVFQMPAAISWLLELSG